MSARDPRVRLPLNGTKTHPLSEHAKNVLQQLKAGPAPAMQFNPGVIDRLLREDAIELVNLPSPHKTVKRLVCHIQLKAVIHTQGASNAK